MANYKHIFIGLGGSGCQTVAQVKEKVYDKLFQKRTETKSRLQAMNDSYRFLFIDTDQRDIDEANKRNRITFEDGKVPFISAQTDLINLGRANPKAIYYEAEQDKNNLINKRILEACSSELAARIPDQPLAFGAGAFRMKSRIAFAHSLADFQSKVQSAISSLNDVKTVGGEDCIIYYWVVASTLGGTGSGIINDVLYHLNQIHHQVVGNGDPQLVLTMYMPKVYIDSNATEEKYALNAFGVFTELEAFKAMSYNAKQNTVMHRLAFKNDYSLIEEGKRYCPFYYLIPIDIQTDKGTSLGTTRTMYRNTAEMLYHLHHGKAGDTFRSDLDNYMNDIMDRNPKDFLVPMGYVSLQKPTEQFNKYLQFRLTRDVLRTWLLADNASAAIKEEEIDKLYKHLFSELNPNKPESIISQIMDNTSYQTTKGEISGGIGLENDDLDESLKWENIGLKISALKDEDISDEDFEKFKKIIVDDIWAKAEDWICTRGLKYTYNAIDGIRKKMASEYDKYETKEYNEDEIQGLAADAADNSLKEKIGLSPKNRKQIDEYLQKAQSYLDEIKNDKVAELIHKLSKDFCADDKNDELSKLRQHISRFIDRVTDMSDEAVKNYKRLANDLGDSALDVTTVYLPQLSNIADGNAWKHNNIFSTLYKSIIKAKDDNEETPDRDSLWNFISRNIYKATDESIIQNIKSGEYEESVKDVENPDKEKSRTRFFCKDFGGQRKNEKIVKDFLALVYAALRNERKKDDIQERWDNKKISLFFNDLTNEVKDEVRRSLNPALFFSYNANRIDVMKKEEHIVFVAGNEDLAAEMLGFQKSNPKHRFVKADDEDTALVLKSKYGLSLEDYRIYDSIKMVYDKATFREKYHFHHDFAQFQENITLDDLPEEILPQHRSFAKMLLLDKFVIETAPFFYEDKYDDEHEVYTNTMYIKEFNTFKIAQPEAFSIHPSTGLIVLKKDDNGRKLYLEINGNGFVEQFANYRDLYFNYRFGETVDNILQAILRQTRLVDGKSTPGETVFKQHYTEKREALLKDLNNNKKSAMKPAERRLWNALFNIVREEFDTVQKFLNNQSK